FPYSFRISRPRTSSGVTRCPPRNLPANARKPAFAGFLGHGNEADTRTRTGDPFITRQRYACTQIRLWTVICGRSFRILSALNSVSIPYLESMPAARPSISLRRRAAGREASRAVRRAVARLRARTRGRRDVHQPDRTRAARTPT